MAPGRRGQQGSRPLRADVVVPDESGITPGYEQLEIDQELLKGDLVPMAPAPQPAARTHPADAPRRGRSAPPTNDRSRGWLDVGRARRRHGLRNLLVLP
jgi:hypothetical protein